MLTYNEARALFAGFKQAAKGGRDLTPDDAAQAIEDAHTLLASVVSDLSDIARYCNERSARDIP